LISYDIDISFSLNTFDYFNTLFIGHAHRYFTCSAYFSLHPSLTALYFSMPAAFATTAINYFDVSRTKFHPKSQRYHRISCTPLIIL
jgi:hypothetical protein